MSSNTNFILPEALMNTVKNCDKDLLKIGPSYGKGRITNLWKEREDTNCIIQGVKGRDQQQMDYNPMVRGSNGTYLEIGEYIGTRLYINISLYETPIFNYEGKKYKLNNRVRIECYEEVRKVIGRNVFGRLALTDKIMEQLKDDLISKKCTFTLMPISVFRDTMRVWLQIRIGYKQGDDFHCPFGGYLDAYLIES